jgi:hypothetical protein
LLLLLLLLQLLLVLLVLLLQLLCAHKVRQLGHCIIGPLYALC